MKRPINKGKRTHRYRDWRSLERFHTIGLRLAGFLHQFKTPLHVIQSQAELMLDDQTLSPALRQSLLLIHQNAGRLSTQTRTMMETARGAQDGVQIAPVERLMEEICEAAQTDCRQRNISLEKDIPASSPIRMEPVALEGALHNLVNNAIEAMPKGGTLRIRVYATKGRVGVEISDTGSGMTPKRLAQIQKPFQTNKANGTGLGLYITRHILRRHKAAIQWECKPGHGTKVTVLFPAVKKDGVWRRLVSAFALLAILIAPLYSARTPQLLRLQGRFTDTKIPLTDNLPVRFSIWDTEDGYGNLLWMDVQNVSIQNDMFEVVLGRGKPLTPSVFSGGDRWVELQLGDDAPLRPRYKIPNQYIQAQVAAVQTVPVPMAAPPPVLPVAPPAAPALSAQERHDLELQIEKYKETESETEPAPAPVHPHKRKHVVQPADDSGSPSSVYEVQSGDTLKSIAQKLYGNAELWYDLYYLNRDRLGPMGHLFPGQILVLPTQTPGASAK